MLVFDVEPLLVCPVVAVLILKFELDVGLPRNVRLVNLNDCTRLRSYFVLISEETFSDKTTRNSDILRNKLVSAKCYGFTSVFVCNDGVAGLLCLRFGDFVAHELAVGAGLDVTAMVLVEVAEFVVDVDGSLNLLAHIKDYLTVLGTFYAFVIVPLFNLLNFIGHHVENNAQRKEGNTKHDENCHGRCVAWHWAPGWEHLLLKFALFEGVDSLGNTVALSFRNLH